VMGVSVVLVLLFSMLTYRYIELPGIELGKLWGRKVADKGQANGETPERAS